MPKTIKEFQLNQSTGEVSVEYSDDSTSKFNAADMVRAQTDPVTGGIRYPVAGTPNSLPAALSAVGRGAVSKSTCALLGDSRNHQFCSGGAIANGLTRTKVAVHWLTWFNALNGQPLSVLANYAYSGTKTYDLDGQITSLLSLSTLPEFAFVC